MSPEEPPSPDDFSLAADVAADLDAAPADDRVYRVALQLYEPTRVAEVANRADCAADTARRHLERLAELGVLEQVAANPALYQRNDAYFEWRARDRLAELSTSQLQDRLSDLAAREQAFSEEYDAEGPDDVDALDHADYDQIESVWLDLSEWRTVRSRIRRLEDVRQQRSSETSSEAV